MLATIKRVSSEWGYRLLPGRRKRCWWWGGRCHRLWVWRVRAGSWGTPERGGGHKERAGEIGSGCNRRSLSMRMRSQMWTHRISGSWCRRRAGIPHLCCRRRLSTSVLLTSALPTVTLPLPLPYLFHTSSLVEIMLAFNGVLLYVCVGGKVHFVEVAFGLGKVWECVRQAWGITSTTRFQIKFIYPDKNNTNNLEKSFFKKY